MKKLHTLIVGINSYPNYPLNQCVGDAQKIETYCNSISNQFDSVQIHTLFDHRATKSEITKSIKQILENASDDDTFLLYFSGHGAQESADGRFPFEQDGAIECLVCYPEEEAPNNFLLADKELRFLFSESNSNPHIISVFDCCHSGDMVRSAHEDEKMLKRLSGYFPARTYSDFIFHEKINESEFKTQTVEALIPFKNSIHISACQSNQLAWEDSRGGVFTRFLLRLLSATKSKLNYREIAQFAKISIKDVTSELQTPTIGVQGSGKLDAASSWLGLFPQGTSSESGALIYNEKKGWIYTKGQLMGITEGTELEIVLSGEKTLPCKISEVNLEDSAVNISAETSNQLDKSRPYSVKGKSQYQSLKLHIHNFDHDDEARVLVESILSKNKNLIAVDERNAAFYVNIFNQSIYLSLPGNPFQPLGRQIDLLNLEPSKVEESLDFQLKKLGKWNHFNTIHNPNPNFDKTPIKVEGRFGDSEKWMDITESLFLLNAKRARSTRGTFYQSFQIRVSNISNENLFVTALTLGSDLAISAEAFDNQSVILNAGESKLFFDHFPEPRGACAFETYKEVYNWSHEWFNLKFIVNNFENLTASIPTFLQEGLPAPVTYSSFMGMLPISSFEESFENWGVYTTNVKLENPSLNQVTGNLKEHREWYSESELVAPFLERLYYDFDANALDCRAVPKPNATGETGKGNFKLYLGNVIDNFRRKRIFKKARRSSKFADKPTILAEGDSWFLYPVLVQDTIDYVMKEYPVRSLAWAGDDLENYKKSGSLFKHVKKLKPKYVLISGGGNDIIGAEIEDILIFNAPAGGTAESYLNEVYESKKKKLEELYFFFFNELKKYDFVKQVFVHGYDYPRSDYSETVMKNGWVNKYMINAGISDLEDRQRLINFLIDEFNEMIERVARQCGNATYIDTRNLIKRDEWYDEIHPNNFGFSRVGKLFLEKIEEFEKPLV